MRKKVGAVVLASMALLGFASPAFGDNVNALGGSPAGGGADAPSTVKPIVLADLDADPDRIRDLVIAELPESPERDSTSPASDDERE